MDCGEFRSRIKALLEDQLAGEELSTARSHRESCAPCHDLMCLYERLGEEMNCEQFTGFLDDYLDGSLEPAKREVFDRHLAHCPECECYLESYRKCVELGRSACECPDEEVSEVPEDLLRAILDAQRAEGRPPASP